MSRARDLSKLGNINVLSADDVSSEVGIASTVPRSTLDVRGELQVGTAIKAGPAGVLTATSFSGGTSGNVTGAACTFTTGTFNGNVTIGGTLTYEDVTNIDSLGIVTARAGVNVSGGQLAVGVAYSVGAAGVATAAGFVGPLTGAVTGNVTGNADTATEATNVTAVNNSTTNTTYRVPFLTAATGTAQLQSDNDDGMTYNPSENKLSAINVQGTLATAAQPSVTSLGTLTGLTVSGDVSIADKIVHTGDTNTAIRFSGADTITAETGGSERVRIDSSGRTGFGVVPNATFSENARITIQGTGTNESIYSNINGTGIGTHFTLTNGSSAFCRIGTNGTSLWFASNNNSEQMRLTSGGALGIGTLGDSIGPTSLLVARNEASGYIASFRGIHASNSAQIIIDSPADNNNRPSSIDLANAGVVKWSLGQAYASNSSGAFHIATSKLQTNDSGAKLTISTAGLVGISQDVPVAKLHIKGSSASAPCLVMPDDTNPRFSVGFGNINIGGVGQRLDFYAGDSGGNTTNLGSGARRMVLTAQGKLGIGLTNPSAQFVVGGATNGDMQVTASDANTGESRLFIGGAEQNQKKCAIIFDPDGSGYCRGTLKFCMDGGADTSDVDTSGDHPRMVINRDGEVGVGTDNPASKFVVAANSASAQVELKRTNTNTTGAVGAINWTALDGHSVANIWAKGDGDDEGAHIVFKTTSAAAESNPYGTATVERLRIGSAGQIGIAGANYGTDGQVLTSTGASSAPAWEDAAGGMSEVDIWSFTQNYSISSSGENHIDSNLSRFAPDAGWSKLGTGMTLGSDYWTFPSTGTWECAAAFSVRGFNATSNWGKWGWHYSGDTGSSWDDDFMTIAQGATSSTVRNFAYMPAIFTITNVSTQKIRFAMYWQGNNGGANFIIDGGDQNGGASNSLTSYYIFKKLA